MVASYIFWSPRSWRDGTEREMGWKRGWGRWFEQRFGSEDSWEVGREEGGEEERGRRKTG